VVKQFVPQHSQIDEFKQFERIAPPHSAEVQFKNVLPMTSIPIHPEIERAPPRSAERFRKNELRTTMQEEALSSATRAATLEICLHSEKPRRQSGRTQIMTKEDQECSEKASNKTTGI
jgi:hypothetical protein